MGEIRNRGEDKNYPGNVPAGRNPKTHAANNDSKISNNSKTRPNAPYVDNEPLIKTGNSIEQFIDKKAFVTRAEVRYDRKQAPASSDADFISNTTVHPSRLISTHKR